MAFVTVKCPDCGYEETFVCFQEALIDDMIEKINDIVREYGYEVDKVLYSSEKADIVLKERKEL